MFYILTLTNPGACDDTEVWTNVQVTVHVWLLYVYPNLTNCSFYASGMETDRQINRQTDMQTIELLDAPIYLLD